MELVGGRDREAAGRMSGDGGGALARPWRVGPKSGRTIFALVGDEVDYDADVLIGVMDDPGLAAEVVRLHNETLD